MAVVPAFLVNCGSGADETEPLSAFNNGGRFNGGGGGTDPNPYADGGTGNTSGNGGGMDFGEEVPEVTDAAPHDDEADGEGPGLGNSGSGFDPNAGDPNDLVNQYNNLEGYGGPNNEDGSPNGGPDVYREKLYGACPIVRVSDFCTAAIRGEPDTKATAYVAQVLASNGKLAAVPESTGYFTFLISSDFGGLFPLGYTDPPFTPSIFRWFNTSPFPTCKRCVTVDMNPLPDGTQRVYFAVGGLLGLSQFPFPSRGRIIGRSVFNVLLEHRKGALNRYWPVLPPEGKCLRIPDVKLVSNRRCG